MIVHRKNLRSKISGILKKYIKLNDYWETSRIIFFIGSILILVITFYPETNTFIADDDLTEDKNSSSNINITVNNNLPDNFKNFSLSDFDLFVYRAHVLSSKENSEAIVNKVNNGGLPAFFEYLKRTINYLLFMLALLYRKWYR